MSDIQNEVWSEIKITVDTNDIEAAGNIANMVVPYGICKAAFFFQIFFTEH